MAILKSTTYPIIALIWCNKRGRAHTTKEFNCSVQQNTLSQKETKKKETQVRSFLLPLTYSIKSQERKRAAALCPFVSGCAEHNLVIDWYLSLLAGSENNCKSDYFFFKGEFPIIRDRTEPHDT